MEDKPRHENSQNRDTSCSGIDTELKKAQEQLEESEGRYKSLFDNNHSVMLLIDPETGNIVDANPAAQSFYGYSHEEITQKKISAISIETSTSLRSSKSGRNLKKKSMK